MEEARRLGYDARPSPKGFVGALTCKGCGNCVFGCRQGAKWDSRRYLTSMPMAGAAIRTRTRVERLLFDGDRVAGVVIAGKEGKEPIEAEIVVLAAGAVNTPVILQRSGIESGKGLFVDYFCCVCGITDGANQLRGQTMAALIDQSHECGFMISPFIDDWLQYLLFCPLSWHFRAGFSRRRTVGLMVKIADERSGEVRVDGKVLKKPTEADRSRMETGVKTATEILRKSDATKLTTTRVWRGAHPGGTAAIGEVIDNNLKVRGRKGLYVCDASMFPFAPGLPPILTITAVGKWLGKRI
jgi:choline dehydrogenase-like flavoprotein